MMKATRLTTVLIALLLASAAVPAALADDGEDEERGKDEKDEEEREESRDDEDDEDDDRNEREVTVDVSDEKAELKYERKVNATEDELKFSYDASEGVVKMSYEEKTDATELENKLDVRVRELLEYADENANGKYDPGTDRVASSFDVGDLAWSMSGVTDTTFGGAPAKTFQASAPLGGSGTFTLRFIAAGAFANESGVSLRPTDLKFDVIIHGYPFTENGTALALLTEVEQKSESKLEVPDDSDSNVVLVSADRLQMYFEWADTVVVDNVTHPVHSTIVKSSVKTESEVDEDGSKNESKSKQVVYLSYPRGDSIVHDPVIGVQSADVQEQPRSPVPALGMAFAVGALAVAGVVLRRRSG